MVRGWSRDGAWCVWVLAGLMMSWTLAEEQLPRCSHQRCRYLGQNKTALIWDKYYYDVEGNTIEFSYDNLLGIYSTLQLDCRGANILGSPALPRVEPAQHSFILSDCPLPAAGSLVDTLATVNVKLCEQDGPRQPCHLWLRHLPAASPLAALHFVGLERLQTILIHSVKKTRASDERDFFRPFKSLHKLTISGVVLPAGVLDALPPLLTTLELRFTGTERLPETIHSSANLQQLSIEDNIPLDAVAVPPRMRYLRLTSAATRLRLDSMPPTLETLSMEHWVESLPPPMSSCIALSGLYLTAPAMSALPDGWLANCSALKHLYITEARNLKTLPPTLFKPGGPLAHLVLRQGALETLPERLLEHLESLTSLELDDNRIKTLPRKFSFGKYYYKLARLVLSRNDLDGSVFEVLEQLKPAPGFRAGGGSVAVLENWQPASLTVLNLAHNPRIGNVCGADGYSRIRRIDSLNILNLNGTGVSRICRDWREGMPQLNLLDLSNTNIAELSYEDLQFKRNIRSQVILQGAPVTAVRLSREEFLDARRAPPSFASMQIDAALECDCRTYWTRRALERSIGLLALPDIGELHCVGGKLLRDVSPDHMMCGAREECAAAELPPGCECAARPDDDPNQDRWLVHVRCENTSLGFVMRRIYPFYPLYKTRNQGFYFTQRIASMN